MLKFLDGKDKTDARLMIFRVKLSKKLKECLELTKKFIVDLFEIVDREKDNNKLTLIFDCTDAELSNVDNDLLMFIISLLRNYYPIILNTVLVYELPSILNYVLKLVHSWLPEDHQKCIDVITKKELNDYVEVDQLPDFLDGTCHLPYTIVPKNVLSAHDLAKQLSISKSADKLNIWNHILFLMISNSLG